MKTYVGNTRYKVLDENGVRRSIESPFYDAEIEYLQGDGSAYINTGIKATFNIRYECSFTITEVPPTNFPIFGARVAYGDRSSVLYYYRYDSGYPYFSWRYGTQDVSEYNVSNIGDYFATSLNAARTMVINGVAKSCYVSTFTTNLPIYIFAINDNGATSVSSSTSVFRIKWMKIYDGTTLVRDFIPVKKNSVGYLYDKVSGQLFGNAGSGSFILGPEVSPSLPSNPVPNDEIWYTSVNNTLLVPETTGYGANLVNHTYADGKGVMKFDGNVTTIPEDAFSNLNGLQTIAFPDSVTAIQGKAFSNCSGLTKVQLGTGLLTMNDNYGNSGGSFTFDDCYNLTEIVSLKTTAATIDNWCFHDFRQASSTTICTLKIPSGATGYDAWKYTKVGADYTLIPFDTTTLEASDYLFLNN